VGASKSRIVSGDTLENVYKCSEGTCTPVTEEEIINSEFSKLDKSLKFHFKQ